MVKNKHDPTKRFGTRYGPRLKQALKAIETHPIDPCKYCGATRVKRVAVGIWTCTKCNATFTGKAYKVK